MLAIYDLMDAIFAEGMAALCDVRVIEGLEAYDALSMLIDYLIYTNFDWFIKFAALPSKWDWWLAIDLHGIIL